MSPMPRGRTGIGLWRVASKSPSASRRRLRLSSWARSWPSPVGGDFGDLEGEPPRARPHCRSDEGGDRHPRLDWSGSVEDSAMTGGAGRDRLDGVAQGEELCRAGASSDLDDLSLHPDGPAALHPPLDGVDDPCQGARVVGGIRLGHGGHASREWRQELGPPQKAARAPQTITLQCAEGLGGRGAHHCGCRRRVRWR